MEEQPAVSDRDNDALSVRIMRPTRVGRRTQAHLLPRGEVDDLLQSKRTTEKVHEVERREDVKARLPPERG